MNLGPKVHKYPTLHTLADVHEIVRKINRESDKSQHLQGDVRFQGTVKLNGETMGLRFLGKEMLVQSQNCILDDENTGNGFWEFTQEHESALINLAFDIRTRFGISLSRELVLYGEWIGRDVCDAPDLAVSQIDGNQFVIFDMRAVTDRSEQDLLNFEFAMDLSRYKVSGVPHVHSVFEADTWTLDIDFNCAKSVRDAQKESQAIADAVGEHCPWGDVAGCEGFGEGVVWKPTLLGRGNTSLYFKTMASYLD